MIHALGLAPLPTEGGWFRRTAESELRMPDGQRRVCSAIYFLVTPEGFSALHLVDAVETWCYHAGDDLEMLVLDGTGETGRLVTLGADVSAGAQLQWMVPARAWQGTRLKPGGRWGLVSCIVAPEFLPESFILGDRAALTVRHPGYAREIAALTR